MISLKRSWALDFDILFVVGSYLSGWYILARRRYCTLISLSVEAVDISMLRMPRESFLFCPTFFNHNSGSRSEFFWGTFRVSVTILASEMAVARCVSVVLD